MTTFFNGANGNFTSRLTTIFSDTRASEDAGQRCRSFYRIRQVAPTAQKLATDVGTCSIIST